MFVTKFEAVTQATAIPLTTIPHDWFGKPVTSPTAFGFGVDPDCLHFRVRRSAPAHPHPDARPGAFTPNLWQYDAAEFFLVHPGTGHYLEFNLAPNGAWWSCEFTAPRQRAHENDIPLPDVQTTGAVSGHAWEATASLPLDQLRQRFQFGPGSRLNATFTLLDPVPLFLTATPLGPGEPDFHQPSRLPEIKMQST